MPFVVTEAPRMHIEKESSLLFSAIVFCTMVMEICYSILFFKLDLAFAGSGQLLGALLLNPAAFYLYYAKKEKCAKSLYLFTANLTLVLASIGMSHQATSEYYFIPIVILSVLMGKEEGRTWTFFFVALSFLSWLGIHLDEMTIDQSMVEMSSFDELMIERFNFIGTFIATTGLGVYYLKTTEQMEKALLEQTKLEKSNYQAISDSMSEGMLIQDTFGVIQSCNKAAIKILRMKEEELIGKCLLQGQWRIIDELNHPISLEHYPPLMAVEDRRSVHSKVIGLEFKNKDTVWLKMNAVGMQGDARNIIITFVDITHERKLDKDIQYLFEQSCDMMCIASLDGKFTHLSPATERILGYKIKDVIGKNFFDYIHKDDIEKTEREIQKLAQGQTTFNFENRYLAKDGTYKVINWTATANPENGFIYASGRDVTEERKESLKRQAIWNLIEQVSILATTDKFGKITSVNDNFVKISGYSREELIGRDHRIVNSGAHGKDFFKKMWTDIKQDKTWSGTVTNRNKNGDLYYVKTFISPLKNLDGDTEEFLAVRVDLTDLKKMEEQLVEAQSIAKVGSWSFEFETSHQYWSREHYNIFEIPYNCSPDILYEEYRKRIHIDDVAELDRLVERAKYLGENFVYNHRVVLDNGNRIKHVQGIGRVHFDKLGRPSSIAGTCQDITELYNLQAENKLVLESMKIGMWKCNLQTGTFEWDDMMFNLYQVESDTKVDFESWKKILSPASQLALDQLIVEVNEGKDQFELIYEIPLSEGKSKFIGSKGIVRRDEYGHPLEVMGINWDESTKVQMERELQLERSKSLQTAKLASLGEMSAGVAHEINNPLAVIVGGVEIMGSLRDDEQKFLVKQEKVLKAAERIEKIVKGLRKFACASRGDAHKPIHISSLVGETLVLTESKAKRSDVPITCNLNADVQILCDEVEIEQVLVNLVNNAVDAVKGTSSPWVKIESHSTEKEVVFRVHDSGPGISKDIEDKIFNPFFTTKIVGEGTGLGLSIVKGILDQHNATIEVNRNFNHTCFEVRFQKYREHQNVA